MAEPRRSIGEEPDDVAGARILVVEARFYADISDALLQGAARVLDEARVAYEKISVPGSLEIAPAISMAVEASEKAGRPIEGAVALGCVIRGETLHFEIVSELSARGVMDVSVARKIPIGNGILTVDTEAQAFARARVTEGDKGGEAARAALTLIRIKRSAAKAKR